MAAPVDGAPGPINQVVSGYDYESAGVDMGRILPSRALITHTHSNLWLGDLKLQNGAAQRQTCGELSECAYQLLRAAALLEGGEFHWVAEAVRKEAELDLYAVRQITKAALQSQFKRR